MVEDYLPHVGIGQTMLVPLLVLGMFSVVYWRLTDDLRLYALVQFLPLIIIAVLLVCYEPRHSGQLQQALALILYALAKVSEDRDYEIFTLTKERISGHSLKHILAGMASISIALMLV